MLFMVLPVGCWAQWGVRFTFLDWDRMSNVEVLGKAQLGLGLDFDTGPRTGMGVEVKFDPGIFSTISAVLPLSSTDAPVSTTEMLGSQAFYNYGTKSFALELRSMYFFTDNTQAAAYVGPFIGVRSYTMDLTYESQHDDYFNTSYKFPNRLTGSRIVVPFGMRVGVRDDLNSFFSDLHFSLGYQIGGGGVLFDTPYEMRIEPRLGPVREMKMTGFTVGFGWALGIGTDGKGKSKS